MRAAPRLVSLAAMLLLPVFASPAEAEKRIALVVGIDAYENVEPLQKAVNDARAIGTTLQRLGFEVVTSENPKRRAFNRAVLDMSSRLAAGDIALFFFAGHGVRIEGRNYLLPSDIPAARPGQEGFVAAEAVAADTVLDAMRQRGVRISLLILDACRDNPFAREGTRSLGGDRGLARMAAPEGSFIMYSAGVGQTALDRLGEDDINPNSVFTRSLIPLLETPDLPVTELARQVRRDVQELASSVGHDQRPAYYDEITAEFAIAGEAPTPTPVSRVDRPAPATPPAPTVDDKAIELAFWNSVRDSDNPSVFRSYLQKYPNGDFAALAAIRIEELERAATAGAEAAPTPVPAPVGSPRERDPAIELAYWNSVRESRDPAVLQSYLDRFPDGEFVDIARLRIQELNRPPTPVVAPPPPPTRSSAPASPSFDCGRATLPSEISICRSSELARLDRQLSELYKARRSSGSTASRNRVRDYQRAWLNTRNACGYDENCLRQQYYYQIDFLSTFSG